MRAIEHLREHGTRRRGTPAAGFRFVRPDGRPVPAAEAARLAALRLPPAWTEVFASPDPATKLQAIGRDRAGRWQYRYHPAFTAAQARAKYRRLLRFAAALPRIRARVDAGLRRRGPSRDRVIAGMARILEACFMRAGSEAYARANRSYGLATIRPRHVRVLGDRVIFDYRGKSGQRQVRELRDRRVARLVLELLRVPGRDVFKFVEGGEVVDVRRRHVNACSRHAAGAPFTAKDFRTWAGTLLCASALARAEAEACGPRPAARRRIANAALRDVAARLGNTPAVARASYVSPAVIEGHARGEVLPCCLQDGELPRLAAGAGLHRVERALVAYLRAAGEAPAGRARAARERGAGARDPEAPRAAARRPARGWPRRSRASRFRAGAAAPRRG